KVVLLRGGARLARVGLQGRIDGDEDLCRAMIVAGCRQCSAIATRSVGAFAAAHAVAARAEAVIVQGIFFSKAIANVVLEMGEVRTAARTLGLEATTFEIRPAGYGSTGFSQAR